ncbi:MAG TPA: superoxide dismutase [Campylobacterales bacterium]|nr:superoxide dismutase [Campylobacterales bacterium]
MTHTLMKLPFDEGALEPHISRETVQFHFGKHHAGYVNKLNGLIKDTIYEDMSLEEIIKTADGGVFNNASQVYNHDFYFNGLSSKQSRQSELLAEWIDRDFGSIDKFKEAFLQTAANLFGAGWVWLSVDKNMRLVIEAKSNADNPLLDEHTPLMTCDVWEHAYYIDYRNARAEYLDKWWYLVNWDFASQNLATYVECHALKFQCDERSNACGYAE